MLHRTVQSPQQLLWLQLWLWLWVRAAPVEAK